MLVFAPLRAGSRRLMFKFEELVVCDRRQLLYLRHHGQSCKRLGQKRERSPSAAASFRLLQRRRLRRSESADGTHDRRPVWCGGELFGGCSQATWVRSAALQAVGDQTLSWQDGTQTQLHVEVVPEPGSLCVGPYFARMPGDITDGTVVEAPARIHAVTQDGRADAEIPGRIMAVTSRAQGWQNVVSMEGSFRGPRAAVEGAGARLPTGGAIAYVAIDASRTPAGVEGQLAIRTAPPTAADVTPTEVEPTWRDKPLLCSSASASGDDQIVQGKFGTAP